MSATQTEYHIVELSFKKLILRQSLIQSSVQNNRHVFLWFEAPVACNHDLTFDAEQLQTLMDSAGIPHLSLDSRQHSTTSTVEISGIQLFKSVCKDENIVKTT